MFCSEESGFVCYCFSVERTRAIVINWLDGKVAGYSCEYPNCPGGCQVIKDHPVLYSADPCSASK